MPDETTTHADPVTRLRTKAQEQAKQSAMAIRRAIADPTSVGEPSVTHLLMARPRRGMWIKTWSNLPGLMLDAGTRSYTHTLLPGWQYTPREMKTEMVEDLERFADTGEQPKEATR
jgi:hypothetical protein